MDDKDINREIKGLYVRIDKLHSNNQSLENEINRLKLELEQATKKNHVQAETIFKLQHKADISQLRENSPAEIMQKYINEKFQGNTFHDLLQENANLKGQVEAFKYCLKKSNYWEDSE